MAILLTSHLTSCRVPKSQRSLQTNRPHTKWVTRISRAITRLGNSDSFNRARNLFLTIPLASLNREVKIQSRIQITMDTDRRSFTITILLPLTITKINGLIDFVPTVLYQFVETLLPIRAMSWSQFMLL